jgi:iron complex outermembrane recepter protein
MISIRGTYAGVRLRFLRPGYFRLAVTILLLAFLGVGRAAFAGDLDTVSPFHIPAESLDKALLQFGAQAHVQIMFAWNSKTGLTRTKEVIGDYSGRTVLASLLRGTGLSYSQHGNTIAVMPRKSRSAVGGEQAKSADRLTEGGAQPVGDPPQTPADDLKAAKKQQNVPLQEITITGTHIRSATGSVLPTQTFTREDVDRSGLGTVSAFLETLPENFSGGMSETTDGDFAGGGQAGENATVGTGVNLRGLGNDATLVLLDGHRLAPADLFGNFIDLSLIPEDAVGRIDVVTDGASAIYGSDAVGGVVNITTRQDFNGAETRVRFGSDDRNDIHESEIGQTFGRAWGSGSALVAYEFYDKTPLSAADRDFTQSVPLPFTLLPEQVRQSALATLEQSITQNVVLYSDVYFFHRSTNSYDSILGIAQQHDWSMSDSYGAILGARYAITDSTELDVSGDYSVGSAEVQELELPQPLIPYFDQKAKSILSTEEAVLNGALWSLPAGRVLYAVGAQFREESYDLADDVAHTVFAPSRDVSSGFAELRIPVFGPRPNSAGQNELELSLADREEGYSDVGSTNNETLGLLWVPAESLRVTGTYGTSFVAPLLNYTNPALSQVVTFNTAQVPGSTPPGSAPVNLLFEFGGNPHLKPQTATTWTLGTTWNSLASSGVRARINYYRIRFDNRINDLEAAGYNPSFALVEASHLGPQIVQLNPPAALVQQLESSPSFVNFGATNLNDIGALIDARELNLSKVSTDGMDFGVADRIERGLTTFEPGVDATVIFHLNTQFTGYTPPAEVLNTLYNPTRAKVRGRVVISRAQFSVAGFVNFVNSYTNNTTIPYDRISSWTTFDLSATYSCKPCRAFLPGFTATLGMINLLNRAPPYARNGSGFAVNYDGANASPLGRFISLDLAVRW